MPVKSLICCRCGKVIVGGMVVRDGLIYHPISECPKQLREDDPPPWDSILHTKGKTGPIRVEDI